MDMFDERQRSTFFRGRSYDGASFGTGMEVVLDNRKLIIAFAVLVAILRMLFCGGIH